MCLTGVLEDFRVVSLNCAVNAKHKGLIACAAHSQVLPVFLLFCLAVVCRVLLRASQRSRGFLLRQKDGRQLDADLGNRSVVQPFQHPSIGLSEAQLLYVSCK